MISRGFPAPCAGFFLLAALPQLMLAGAIKSELAVVLISPACSYLPHGKRRMGKTSGKCLQGRDAEPF